MERDIQLHFVTIQQNIQRAHTCIIRLDEIALKHYPLSDVGYIDLLIEAEIQDEKPDYQKRVHCYHEVRKQVELISKQNNCHNNYHQRKRENGRKNFCR